MLSDESFQKLLFDLFCLWHDVQRHYDPPITHTEEEKMQKVKHMICKLLGEIDSRVKKIKELPSNDEQEFIEEWTMLTWNVLCITSRFQNSLTTSIRSSEDKVIFSKLNVALVELVNHSRTAKKPPTVGVSDATFDMFANRLAETMHFLHDLYRTLKSGHKMTPDETETFAHRLQTFADQSLVPFVDMFKTFCNEQSVRLWQQVRQAQIARMVDYRPMPHEPVNQLVGFYSHMMHRLAMLCARLQGFRYELTVNKVFGDYDPVRPLSDSVFSALELLMSDCVLATEPSTNPILVTNNLFAVNCGALARGVVFKQFDIQIVTEEAAEHIQSEMRRQKMLQQPSPIAVVPSAALLAMKPTSGTKRANQSNETQSSTTTTHKKSDVNSKDIVTIYPVFNSKNRYWAASYPHLLCTTRQKGRHSTHNSFQDLSPGGVLDAKSNGKRPIFYFHIRATMFSPLGRFADAHTLSLPLTIATRRNQDCQVQRMMSSYTATCFWLYGSNSQDGLLLQWVETGMKWEKFKVLFAQHFRVNAEVTRGLQDCDFDLLQYKIQCNDCKPSPTLSSSPSSSNVSLNSEHSAKTSGERVITFKNMLCPHLRYECGSTNVRFSVWRGMLELLQIFQDSKTNVRKMWERQLIMGFLEFDQVSEILAKHQSALIMRLSFVTGGTICFTVKSNAHSLQKGATAPMHLEPLDLKKLQAKCLKDYLRDIAAAEKVKYIINSNCEPIRISEVVTEMNSDAPGGVSDEQETSRHISSNVTHVGDIDAMQHITFTAMRIAVVTCKVKPPSADAQELDASAADDAPSPALLPPPSAAPSNASTTASCRLPAQGDDFVREIIQLCNFHGKSKQDLVNLLDQAPENLFAHLTLGSSGNPSPLAPQVGGNFPSTTAFGQSVGSYADYNGSAVLQPPIKFVGANNGNGSVECSAAISQQHPNNDVHYSPAAGDANELAADVRRIIRSAAVAPARMPSFACDFEQRSVPADASVLNGIVSYETPQSHLQHHRHVHQRHSVHTMLPTTTASAAFAQYRGGNSTSHYEATDVKYFPEPSEGYGIADHSSDLHYDATSSIQQPPSMTQYHHHQQQHQIHLSNQLPTIQSHSQHPSLDGEDMVVVSETNVDASQTTDSAMYFRR